MRPGSGKEPANIVVRNSTTENITSVTLAESTGSDKKPYRFGMISPVPAGTSQVYVRPSDPPRLPRNVEVKWVDYRGVEQRKFFSLSQLLRTAPEREGGSLVVEFLRNGEVTVFLEGPPQ